uniref:WSC domain-containing protein 1-like n=1 Tax=Ciona intestinalis TaxID=7719 RepID=UPI000521777E|nr:WSC domain-containing protein 1-like [Ciona intestinalis]|eukprot:XP_009860420.3 WSC domain-containing protein 1-like [Ciona intestinalis]
MTYILLQRNICACTSQLQDLVDLETSNNCSMTCEGNSHESCGGYNEVNAYQVLENCVAGRENVVTSKHFLGCFAPASNWTKDLQLRGTRDTKSCILVCEHQMLPMAVVDHLHKCWCGYMTDRFNQTHRIMSAGDCGEKHLSSVYHTIHGDNRCQPTRFLNISETRFKVGLLSMPGAGNTWVRYMLDKTTGVYTGSHYRDKALFKSGLLGELQPKGVAIVKDHIFERKNVYDYNSAVILIRNPYDAWIAEFNRKMSNSHVGSVNKARYYNKGFKNRFVNGSRSSLWVNMIDEVIKSKKRFYVVFYEDLKTNAITELRKIVGFLATPGLKSDDLETRLHCLSLQINGQNKRNSDSEDFDPFDDDMKMLVNSQIRFVRELLRNNSDVELPVYER